MTVLALTTSFRSRKRNIPFGPAKHRIARMFFSERVLAWFFLSGIMFFLAFYVSAMYVMFGLESVLRKQEVRIKVLSEEASELDYTLRERIASIPKTHAEYLSSLERVSSIRYIGGEEGYAAFRGVTVP